MANKELDLTPETGRERHDREMRAISDEENKGLKERLAQQEAAFQREVKEVMEAGYTRKKAEEIVNQKYMPSTKSKKKKPESMMDGGMVRKKKKTAKKMMGGGKVYTMDDKRYAYGGKVSGRKPKYNG